MKRCSRVFGTMALLGTRSQYQYRPQAILDSADFDLASLSLSDKISKYYFRPSISMGVVGFRYSTVGTVYSYPVSVPLLCRHSTVGRVHSYPVAVPVSAFQLFFLCQHSTSHFYSCSCLLMFLFLLPASFLVYLRHLCAPSCI